MKRFRFPLQPVAVLRAHREAKAQQAFAAATQVFQQASDQLAAARARVARFETSLFEGRRERFSAADEAQALAAYRRERSTEAEAERALQNAQAAMQQRRDEYLEAHRKVEVVRRLETKARAAHRQTVAREEQAEFDDFAGRRIHARRAVTSL